MNKLGHQSEITRLELEISKLKEYNLQVTDELVKERNRANDMAAFADGIARIVIALMDMIMAASKHQARGILLESKQMERDGRILNIDNQSFKGGTYLEIQHALVEDARKRN